MLQHEIGIKDSLEKDRLYNKYKLLALNIFEYENLPNNIESRHIEEGLFNYGQVVFFNDDEYGFLCLPCSELGDVNIYGDSKSVIANGFNYQKNILLINSVDSIDLKLKDVNKGIRILNNDLKQPMNYIIRDYANKMREVEKSINLNIRQQKYPYIVKTNKNNELTLKTMVKKIDEGEEVAIFSAKGIDSELFDVFNLSVPYVVDKLNNYKYELEREILTDLGLNNNFEKKERLLTDEINSNNDYIFRKVELMYKTRKQAIDLINQVYGLDIKIKKVDNFHNELENNVSEIDEEVNN